MFILPSGGSAAKDSIYHKKIHVSKIVKVYDGDTIFVNINQWPAILGKRMPVRVRGIDTPEMRGKCQKEKVLASKAKLRVIDELAKAKNVTLRNISRGKYFRVVADVYADDINIGDVLLYKGLAVPYDGGTKTKDWCR